MTRSCAVGRRGRETDLCWVAQSWAICNGGLSRLLVAIFLVVGISLLQLQVLCGWSCVRGVGSKELGGEPRKGGLWMQARGRLRSFVRACVSPVVAVVLVWLCCVGVAVVLVCVLFGFLRKKTEERTYVLTYVRRSVGPPGRTSASQEPGSPCRRDIVVVVVVVVYVVVVVVVYACRRRRRRRVCRRRRRVVMMYVPGYKIVSWVVVSLCRRVGE